MSWRFHLLTLPGRVWVDHDLPLQGGQVVESVSAPAVISGSLPLGYAQVRTAGDDLAIREWGSAIVAEREGRAPVFGIVDSVKSEGDSLMVEAGGFASYPAGMPWTDSPYSGVQVDALDVVRMIWDKLQAKSGGNLGVVVDAAKANVLLGTPEDPKLTAAKASNVYWQDQLAYADTQAKEDAILVQQGADATLLAAGLPTGGLLIRAVGAPSGDKRSKRNLWLVGNAEGLTAVRRWDGKKWVDVAPARVDPAMDAYFEYLDRQETLKASKEVLADTKKRASAAKSNVSDLREGEAVPFLLNWWESHDLGSVIDELAKQVPFDYREVTAWDGEGLSHRLEIGVPTLGARRPDLRFEVGVNVRVAPPVDEGEYASEVVVLGSGEGRAMVRSTTSGHPGRLRRVVVVERKDASKKTVTDVIARNELRARNAEWTFDALEILDHPMAPYGSFAEGDEIYVNGDAGWVQLDHWVRILSITTDCDTGAMSLRVEVS